MKQFLGDDFLLSTGTALHLYEQSAKNQPIFDWHCHLDPRQILEDKSFENLTRVWLSGDHYKWRAMRAVGVPERLITGDAPDYDKFLAWAGTLPHLIGNPLYHWSHLELRRFFDIREPLDEKSAPAVWEQANERLRQPEFTPRGLIKRSRVTALCTTDDPADSLEYHARLRQSGFAVRVLPALRPDRALRPDVPGFTSYLQRLGEAAGMEIATFHDLQEALERRMDVFDALGCRASDHGFSYLPYTRADGAALASIFAKVLSGKALSQEECDAYQTELLLFLAEQYHRRGWVMELHVGALRDNNRRMHELLGPDSGFDAVNDAPCAGPLARLLSDMDARGALPRTVVFNLNPKDNLALAALIGCFQGDDSASRLQFGSAWWFLDNKPGMRAQMETLALTGALSKFVGMVTDSRSFLSYPRHEYFRRILCELLGDWVENGEYPNDPQRLHAIVTDICYENARRFFRLDEEDAS